MAKILLIEDESDLAAVTKVRLESAGYEVLVTGNAEDALGLLQKNTPDLILLDLLLPKMQGGEACKLLKSDNNLKHVPVILFTASVSDIPKIAKEVGADDYILKPYEPKELLAKIKSLLKE